MADKGNTQTRVIPLITDSINISQSLRRRGLLLTESKLPLGLIKAYRETHYEVLGRSGLVLIVGQQNRPLALAHVEYKVDCSAYITACNPYSRSLSRDENFARQAALAVELRERSLRFLDAMGRHPTNGWEGEPSFLVFGMSLEATKALGRRLEQNAIVWSGADATPQLILLR